jgi:hypothetical protein
MLIKVFGIWLMATNITFLEDFRGDCTVSFFTGGNASYVAIVKYENKSCDEVAKEINRLSSGVTLSGNK